MRNRIILGIAIVVIGLLLIGLAVAAIYLNLQSAATVIESTPEPQLTVSAVVAARDLSAGAYLLAEDLQIVQVPVDFLPRTALTEIDEAVERLLKVDLVQGEMVLEHNLVDPTNIQNQDIAFILREDHVLMAFPSSDLMSQSNIIKRGDVVDIYASFDVEYETGETIYDPNTETYVPEVDIDTFTFDAMQGTSITALVVEIIDTGEAQSTTTFVTQTNEDGSVSTVPVVSTPAPETNTISFLIALNPQDALILKNLIDQNAVMSLVLRNPASTLNFRLDPVSDQYLIERYGLYVIP